MPRFVKSCALALFAALVLGACTSAPSQKPTTLQIAAADNLRPVMEDLARDYRGRQPWIEIKLIFNNTAGLEQHLQKSAVDLYIPARSASIDALVNHDAIAPKSRFLLAINQLVAVAGEDSALPLDVTALTDPSVRQIAVADPNRVMLGFLTHQALTNLNLVPSHDTKPLVEADTAAANNIEPKLLQVASEADVLTAIQDGRAQIGITYSTYATADKNVRILVTLTPGSYESISYYAVILRNAPQYDEAWNFLNYLRSAQARAIMQRDGLLVE
jgi:molybdate transport system substrate-binding protein